MPTILSLPRLVKRGVALAVDAGLCIVTVWLAIYLRMGEFYALTGPYAWAALTSIVIAIPVFVITGLYRAIFRYSGWPALMTVARAMFAYSIIFAAIFLAIGIQGVPRTVGIIQPILLVIAIGCSRTIARYWLGGVYQRRLKQSAFAKALIYGAGNAGRQLAAAIAGSSEMRVLGFLDDDAALHGQVLNGLPIFNPQELPTLAATLKIENVLLALPSISRRQRNEILKKIQTARIAVRTLPSVIDLAQGRVQISDLRELDIDDLLGREPVTPNQELLTRNIVNKTILITGAGGSIGSELCRQVISLGPKALLLVDQSEYALYTIHQELLLVLANSERKVTLVPLLASVRDEGRIRDIFVAWKPETVYHAAAYKHVPMVEHNFAEGLKNNVQGTLVVAKIAQEELVKNFVLISTDKAVRPTNVMGASKRIAELILQALAADTLNHNFDKTEPSTKGASETIFSIVRFGNVLGSSGSVVPKFRDQIREGGPITLTHPDITRYFMSIPEAAQLVIQAGAMGVGGDVFVLDMGQPIRIIDLAKRMIELSGLSILDHDHPEGDVAIEIIGLRPGEKLYEELLIGDNPTATAHPRIMRAMDEFFPWQQLADHLESLQDAVQDNEIVGVRAVLQQLVKGYSPSE